MKRLVMLLAVTAAFVCLAAIVRAGEDSLVDIRRQRSIASTDSALAASPRSPIDLWREKMAIACNPRRGTRGEYNVKAFDEAIAVSPDAAHKAMALVALGTACETAMKRPDAIAAYKRLTAECPGTPEAVEGYFRLGELYSYRRLVRSEDPAAADAAKEMSLSAGLAYFENAARSGPPGHPFALAGKLCVGATYLELGRKEEALKVLGDVASADIYQVRTPYLALSESSTLSERFDADRLVIATMRAQARTLLDEEAKPAQAADAVGQPADATGPSGRPKLKIRILESPETRLSRLAEILSIRRGMPSFAYEPTDFDKEMTGLLEMVKSEREEDRTDAIRELVGIREVLSDELGKALADVNSEIQAAGRVPLALERKKSSLIQLIGYLGLYRLRPALESELDWQTKSTSPGSIIYIDGGRVAKGALELCGFSNAVTPEPAPATVGLDAYPSLREAVRGRKPDELTRWYNDMDRSLRGILEVQQSQPRFVRGAHSPTYGEAVTIAAIYLQGEYRLPYNERVPRTEYINLKDDKGLTRGYAASLRVAAPDADYPMVVALLKRGMRKDTHGHDELDTMTQYARLACSVNVPAETRERIARVMVAIDSASAGQAFDKCLAETLRREPGASEALQSVASIIRQEKAADH